jgi:hypothetical protein
MHNAENYDSYINIPSSHTHRLHWSVGLIAETECVSSEVRTISRVLNKREDDE